MKIHLPPKKIMFRLERISAGNLTEVAPSARPWGEILSVGSDVPKEFKVGQKIFVAPWGPEEVEYEKEKYHFIDFDHPAVCGTLK